MKYNRFPLLSSYTKFSFLFYIFSQVFFPSTIVNQVAMIIFVSLIFINSISHKKFYLHIYFLFAILFIAHSYINILFGLSINNQTSLKMITTLIINFILTLAVFNYVQIYDNLGKILFQFANIITGYLLFLIVLSNKNIFTQRLGNNIQLEFLGEAVIYNANTIAILAGIAFLIYLNILNNQRNISYIFLLFFCAITIFLTGSRKGLMLLLIGAPGLLFLINPQKKIRNFLISILGGFVLYWSVLHVPVFYNIVGQRMESLVNIILGADVDEASANTRNLYIERGWNYFIAKPWSGYGLDNFRNLAGSYGTYSHNNYIELLTSGGIISFFLFYFVKVQVFIELLIKKKSNNFNSVLAILVFSMLILEYGFVSYYDRIYLLVFIIAISGNVKKWLIAFK